MTVVHEAKDYIPGLGSAFKIAANEIAAGVVVGSATDLQVLAAPHSVPVASLRSDAGAALVAAESAGTFNVSVASNVLKAQAEITDNETEVSVCLFQFTLPNNYIPGGAISVRLPVKLVKTAAAVDNGSSIDLSVYKQAALAVGSDLVSTAAQVFAAVDTNYNKDFVVDPTGLVAGDELTCKVTSSIIDSEAGGGTLRLNMDAPIMLVDIYSLAG